MIEDVTSPETQEAFRKMEAESRERWYQDRKKAEAIRRRFVVDDEHTGRLRLNYLDLTRCRAAWPQSTIREESCGGPNEPWRLVREHAPEQQ